MEKDLDREVDRMLSELLDVIRERGFTQLEVQEALGWGCSYISQLLTKQKSLRVKQVFLILGVVNVEPAEFFSRMYGEHAPSARELAVRRLRMLARALWPRRGS